MKPILIFAKEKDGTINITKEELQRVVEEAYEQGKADGIGNYWTTPVPVPVKITPNWEGIEITCEG